MNPATRGRSRGRGRGGPPEQARGKSAAEAHRWTSEPRAQPRQATGGRSRHREHTGGRSAKARGTAVRQSEDAINYADGGAEPTGAPKQRLERDVISLLTQAQ